MKMVDYVADGGDGNEIICNTKQQAIKVAQMLANETGETIPIQRWFRPDRDSDLELDDSFELNIKPNKEGE